MKRTARASEPPANRERRLGRTAAGLFALGFVSAACNLFQRDRVLEIGQIQGPVAAIAVPDTVMANQEFVVFVPTSGNTCVSAARTEIEYDGRDATITPYNYRYTEGLCLDIELTIPHHAAIRFATPGRSRVIIRGGSQLAAASSNIHIVVVQ